MCEKIILLLFVFCSLLATLSYVLWKSVSSIASDRDDYAMLAMASALWDAGSHCVGSRA